MKLISHRGNLNGRNINRENSPEYIKKAIKLGFDVEIDVWYINNEIYLGHDNPEYLIDIDFLKNEKLWCHAKNIEALGFMIENDIHCFFHQEDDVTLTSKNFLWVYPNKPYTKNSILVIKDDKIIKNKNLYGICSDYVSLYPKLSN